MSLKFKKDDFLATAKKNAIQPQQNYLSQVKSGVRYDRYGSRHGFGSALDQGKIRQNAENLDKTFGGGKARLAMVDRYGNPDQNATLEFNNRLFKANAKGVFNVIDQKYLQEVRDEYLERQSYINDMTELCAISDEVCSKILDFETVNEFNDALAPGNTILENVDQKIKEADGRPSFLHNMHESTANFAYGVHKLKLTVEALMPIVEKLSEEKDVRNYKTNTGDKAPPPPQAPPQA